RVASEWSRFRDRSPFLCRRLSTIWSSDKGATGEAFASSEAAAFGATNDESNRIAIRPAVAREAVREETVSRYSVYMTPAFVLGLEFGAQRHIQPSSGTHKRRC